MTVAVVGAGLAGLACASTLAGNGCDVEVFEADARIGGRVRSVADPAGGAWELGAQVIHPGGKGVLVDDLPVTARRPCAVAPERTDLAVVLGGHPVRSWQLVARGIRPWEAASGWPAGGSGTVGRWLRETLPPGVARRCARDWVEQEWGCDADTLDVGQAGGWTTQRAREGGGELVLTGGLGELVDRLAAGVTIHRSQRVDEVAVGRSGVRIRTGSAVVAVDAVVVTVPPWLLRPPGVAGGLVLRGVDPAVVRRAAALPGGDAVAALLTLPEPAPGGFVAFDAEFGFVRCRAGSARIQAVSKGPRAATLRAALRDPSRLAAALTAALGRPPCGGPVEVRVADWGRSPNIRGAFSAPTVGHVAAREALMALQGRGLVMAGEATRRDGTAARMHGAVLSGIDAAQRVGALLAGSGSTPDRRPRRPTRGGST